jgi:tRNA pseudouridine55 synthase
MTRARGDSGLDGFVNLRKPSGPTSHDLVARVRRLLGTRRVGHAGTLDPLAEGVLPIALGRATRLIDRLSSADKEYEAWAVLGLRTTTDDAEGQLLAQADVPDFSTEELQTALDTFVGQIEQVPPAYSAIKVAGRRSYDLARSGASVALASRAVTIESIELRSWERPVLRFRVCCSKGTYIRSLARDLGERLGVGASLRRLIRLRVGPFDLGQAVDLEEVAEHRAALVLPPDTLLRDCPSLVVDDAQVDHLRHGRAWAAPDDVAPDLDVRAYTREGQFAAILRRQDDRWRPILTFLD